MTFFDPRQVPPRELVPGVTLRVMWGERIMMSLLDIAAGAGVPAHTHPAEQMGMVLEGEMEMVIQGQRKHLRAGEAYLIPSNTEHSVSPVSGPVRVLDIFSPPREEYMG